MTQAIPAAVLEQHLAILGKTGRGKTTTAKDCVEQVYDEDFRVCILDTIKSDWWGLTSSADGRRPGLLFHILGGPHAHVPLSSGSGRQIADLVATGKLRHSIIDMADFEPGGQMRFFVDFAPRLLQRMKGVLYVVIEEAHLLAPKERAGIGQENMSIHWAKMLATAGRKKGIRLIVISQRTQALHNAVLGSCDSMIVHGMTAPADMKPVIDWLKANSRDKELNSTIAASLSELPRGTGWVCSGEAKLFERREFPRCRTFDNTKAPSDDEELGEVRTAQVDTAALRELLGKAAAEAEANDPAVLRKRIITLEHDLKIAVSHREAGFTGNELDEAVALAVRAERDKMTTAAVQERKRWQQFERDKARDLLSSLIGKVNLLGADISNHYHAYAHERVSGEPGDAKPFFVEDHVETGHKTTELILGGNPLVTMDEATRLILEAADKDAAAPTGLKAKILTTLRLLEMRGMSPAPRSTLGGLAGFVADKGYGARCLGEMKTAGLITYPVPSTVELTKEGRLVAQEPPNYARTFDAWLEVTTGLHREVLEELEREHPKDMTRVMLGERLGKQFEQGYGARVLGELRTKGAIEFPGPGKLRLTQYVIPS